MKNKNEVTGNLRLGTLGCTVLRITPEVPGAITMQLACPATDSSNRMVIATE